MEQRSTGAENTDEVENTVLALSGGLFFVFFFSLLAESQLDTVFIPWKLFIMSIHLYCKPLFPVAPCGFLRPNIKPSSALPYPFVQTSFRATADFLNYIIT